MNGTLRPIVYYFNNEAYWQTELTIHVFDILFNKKVYTVEREIHVLSRQT